MDHFPSEPSATAAQKARFPFLVTFHFRRGGGRPAWFLSMFLTSLLEQKHTTKQRVCKHPDDRRGQRSDIYFAMRCLRSSSSIIARLTFARFIVPASEAESGDGQRRARRRMPTTVVRPLSSCMNREAGDLIQTVVPYTHAQRAKRSMPLVRCSRPDGDAATSSSARRRRTHAADVTLAVCIPSAQCRRPGRRRNRVHRLALASRAGAPYTCREHARGSECPRRAGAGRRAKGDEARTKLVFQQLHRALVPSDLHQLHAPLLIRREAHHLPNDLLHEGHALVQLALAVRRLRLHDQLCGNLTAVRVLSDHAKCDAGLGVRLGGLARVAGGASKARGSRHGCCERTGQAGRGESTLGNGNLRAFGLCRR